MRRTRARKTRAVGVLRNMLLPGTVAVVVLLSMLTPPRLSHAPHRAEPALSRAESPAASGRATSDSGVAPRPQDAAAGPQASGTTLADDTVVAAPAGGAIAAPVRDAAGQASGVTLLPNSTDDGAGVGAAAAGMQRPIAIGSVLGDVGADKHSCRLFALRDSRGHKKRDARAMVCHESSGEWSVVRYDPPARTAHRRPVKPFRPGLRDSR